MDQRPRRRLLIFVIAYHAEATLRSVLERIPRSVLADMDCEILVVDDASADRTYEVGHEYRHAHPELPLTVLRNPYNQGYGGNQKVGYTYAIEEGHDFVAMVHGDGQYAPERLPELLAPLLAGEADAVFGSRMMTAFGALQGGMPLYKYVGNRILTTAQNALLGTRLSEFHSGYRIYSTEALRRIRFTLNSNDFHFDTEIIIQLLNAGLRIKELAIPTYYGDEISRVNGFRYAKDVMVATTQNALHRVGLMYQRRFDPVPHRASNEHYGLKLGYPSSHQAAVDAVPPGSRVIDVGAGPGGLPRVLAKRLGCQVTAVDREAPAEPVEGVQVVVQDLDAPPTFDVASADVILLLDVLEHLKDPEDFLHQLRLKLDQRPRTLVVSTPNIAFAVQRLMLLLGQFNYGKAGILDRDHTRLFTRRTLLQLLSDEGVRIKKLEGIPAPFPKALGDNPLAHGLLRLNQALIRLSPELFSYQFFVVAETTPDVSFVLRESRRTREPRLTLVTRPPASVG